MTENLESLRDMLSRIPSEELKDKRISPAVSIYQLNTETPRTGPEQATEAYQSISTYGSAFAQYVENLGDAALAEAEKYRTSCYELAANIRNMSEDEANRASRYLNKIHSLARTLDDVTLSYLNKK